MVFIMNRIKALVLAVFFAYSVAASAAAQSTSEQDVAPKKLRIMSVVIVQQEGFLAYLLEPYLAATDVEVTFSQGHHSEVAKAVSEGRIDLAITHSKVKALQKLEKQGVLHPQRVLFANPMAFLGPRNDPAGIAQETDPLSAFKKIQRSGYCFVVNRHHRMQVIQQAWLKAADMEAPCLIEPGNEDFLQVASREQAYTLWSLHPYARKPLPELSPVVLGHPSLLENLSGWAVKGSPAEREALHLLDYLGRETARQRMEAFRLGDFPDQQPWWPPK